MPTVKILEDQPNLVDPSAFKLIQFPYDKLNPVQSRIFEVYDQDCNLVVSAKTAAGKTCVLEMYMANEVFVRGGKAVYLAPMKSLAKEKIDDWTDPSHAFSKLNISICTGDFKLTAARKKELQEANIILLTNEMLNSRCRNFQSENNEWLKEIGTLIADEFHLITTPERGSHAEVGLMKFGEIAKDPRLVLVSATMPNVNEIAGWASNITGKDTYLLESKYRPCPLGVHYETYYDIGKYDEIEEEKVTMALRIRDDYPDDKFLVFVHTKRTGEMMKNALNRAGYPCEFHSSELEKEKRHKLESDFRTGKLQTVVATSTLAWGCNLPARRVIIVGVHRGLQDVENYDIFQEIGRSGRPGYDPRGDAYILVPEGKAEYYKLKLSQPQRIESRLLDYVGTEENPHYKTLAFHIVSEIHHENIKNEDDLHNWYKRSFAYFQANDLHADIVDNTIDLLSKCGAIKINEAGDYEVTPIGKISSMFYYSPFDVADLKRNFKALFDNNLYDNDLLVSMALGNVDTIRMGIVNKIEKEEMGSYGGKIRRTFSGVMDTAIKGGYAYYCLMNGTNLGAFTAFAKLLQFDFLRTKQVLNAIDSMACRWDRKAWFDKLGLRINYGVDGDQVYLCQLSGIGKVKAIKLWNAGLKTLADVADNPDTVQRVLNMKIDKVAELCDEAKRLDMVS